MRYSRRFVQTYTDLDFRNQTSNNCYPPTKRCKVRLNLPLYIKTTRLATGLKYPQQILLKFIEDNVPLHKVRHSIYMYIYNLRPILFSAHKKVLKFT